MPSDKSSARDRLIEKRRERVSELTLRQHSIRQIVDILADEFTNPDTGEPFTHQTIHKDIQYLSKQWQARASAKIDELRAQQFAELQEVKRESWLNQDYKTIIRALETEMKLLGSNEPEKTNAEVRISWSSPFEDE